MGDKKYIGWRIETATGGASDLIADGSTGHAEPNQGKVDSTTASDIQSTLTVTNGTEVVREFYVKAFCDGGAAPNSANGKKDADEDYYYDINGVVIEVKVVVVKVDMTAHRPYTEGPDYGNKFQKREVPDDEEESPGAGIRINGDTELADNENDLIEVELAVEPFPIPSGLTYVLKRNNSYIKVWDNKQGTGTALLDSGTEATITIGSSFMSVWVENPSGGADDLELVARSGGADVCSDKVHFYDFSSIVVVLSGEFETFAGPVDPVPDGSGLFVPGIFRIATNIYASGYDAHMYGEDAVDSEGAGDVYDEIVSAIQDRSVEEVGILGYSHGGGSVYDLAKRLDDNRATIGSFTIKFTAYIDAVENDSEIDVDAETKYPPSSDYHVNFWQTAVEGLAGDTTDTPGQDIAWNVDILTPTVTHGTIDEDSTVLSTITTWLRAKVAK